MEPDEKTPSAEEAIQARIAHLKGRPRPRRVGHTALGGRIDKLEERTRG